ncbi:CoA transferase [Defluviimonas sp. WL0024]|uniref:CoA transferase n=2 Tax=Albidovulum TaxID=205889 RepID=A0ABT3J9H9_9RHOB|nr:MULTISPECIES: CaiB/BaiF CoA-transferase family protein [Defluviimonas]MCU9850646.1 CoA transferase [Defluviimonas sp. WL0024]MCW3784342.1 CoA transferase [Defluviimonas salinarum]
MNAPLAGIRVIDLSVNAPGPFASKMLADLGAEVTCVTNPAQAAPAYAGAEDDPMLSARGGPNDALSVGKTCCALDLKSDPGRAALLDLAKISDVLISEMRPGKLDALGLGWEALRAANPRLVLCEITGYGRTAPHAARAGHDINYLALSGALSLIRDGGGKPVVPQNLIGDYAAGGTMAVAAILAALLTRERTREGRHIDLSMTDGIRYLMADISAATLLAGHSEESWRGTLNGSMPTYDTYRTADGGWIAVGALEPKFIAVIAEGLDWPELIGLMRTKDRWPEARLGLQRRFLERELSHWVALFEASDACVTPVLSLAQAHPAGSPGIEAAIGDGR